MSSLVYVSGPQYNWYQTRNVVSRVCMNSITEMMGSTKNILDSILESFNNYPWPYPHVVRWSQPFSYIPMYLSTFPPIAVMSQHLITACVPCI